MARTHRSRTRERDEVAGRAAALGQLVLAAAGAPRSSGEPAFSPRERALLSRPSAEWDEQDAIDALWRGEALGAIAWALAAVDELPPYDRPFDHVALARSLELDGTRLRPAEELDRARETARLWHWRGRTALLQDGPPVALPQRWSSFDQLIAVAAMRGHEEGILPRPLRGDFPAFGRIYRQLDATQRSLALSIAAERHYALEWILGSAPWDEVETDT